MFMMWNLWKLSGFGSPVTLPSRVPLISKPEMSSLAVGISVFSFHVRLWSKLPETAEIVMLLRLSYIDAMLLWTSTGNDFPSNILFGRSGANNWRMLLRDDILSEAKMAPGCAVTAGVSASSCGTRGAAVAQITLSVATRSSLASLNIVVLFNNNILTF